MGSSFIAARAELLAWVWSHCRMGRSRAVRDTKVKTNHLEMILTDLDLMFWPLLRAEGRSGAKIITEDSQDGSSRFRPIRDACRRAVSHPTSDTLLSNIARLCTGYMFGTAFLPSSARSDSSRNF